MDSIASKQQGSQHGSTSQANKELLEFPRDVWKQLSVTHYLYVILYRKNSPNFCYGITRFLSLVLFPENTKTLMTRDNLLFLTRDTKNSTPWKIPRECWHHPGRVFTKKDVSRIK